MRAINDLRKALDLALSDRIRVAVYADDTFADAAAEHGDWIANEVLAVEWQVAPTAEAPGEVHTIEIDGERVGVALETCGWARRCPRSIATGMPGAAAPRSSRWCRGRITRPGPG